MAAIRSFKEEKRSHQNYFRIGLTLGAPSDTVQIAIPKTLAGPGAKLCARLKLVVTTP